jgi:hypothetical protein
MQCVICGSGGGQNCLRKIESTNSSGHKVHDVMCPRDFWLPASAATCSNNQRAPFHVFFCFQVVEWIEMQRQFEVCFESYNCAL